MEKIITLAWTRFKKNWLKYFLIYLLGILASVALTIAVLLSIGLGFGIYYLLGQNIIVAVILGTSLLLAAIFAFIYLGNFFALAQNLALVGNSNQDMNSTLKSAKPLTWPFLIFNTLSGLFMLGLLYTNVLLFIPLILWAIWGSFSLFAFLDNQRGGLKPLWYSRSKIQGHFWQVLLYLSILFVASFIFIMLFSQFDSKYQVVVNMLSFLFFTPFGICFTYELYRSLPEPTEVKPAKLWLGLSVFGYVILAALIFFSSRSFSQLLKESPLRYRRDIMKQEIPGIHIQGWQEN